MPEFIAPDTGGLESFASADSQGGHATVAGTMAGYATHGVVRVDPDTLAPVAPPRIESSPDQRQTAGQSPLSGSAPVPMNAAPASSAVQISAPSAPSMSGSTQSVNP